MPMRRNQRRLGDLTQQNRKMQDPTSTIIWYISVSLSILLVPIMVYTTCKTVVRRSRFTKIFAVFNFLGILAQISVYSHINYTYQTVLCAIFTLQLLMLFFVGNKNFVVLKLLEDEYPLNNTPFGRIIGITIGLMLTAFFAVTFVYPGPPNLQFVTVLVWSLLLTTLDYSQGLLLLNISLDDHVCSKLGTKNVGLILVIVLTKPLCIFSLGFYILHYYLNGFYLYLAINFAGIQMIIAQEICLLQETETFVDRDSLAENSEGGGVIERLRSFSTDTVVVVS